MARAQSKEELITFSEESWQKLCSLINSLNEETKNTNFTFKVEDKKEKHWARDKNLRDVMVHLYEWHQLLINFVKKNKRGEKTPFLPSPYNWKNYGEMNDNFQINGQKKSLSEITQQLSESHMELITLIEIFQTKNCSQKNILIGQVQLVWVNIFSLLCHRTTSGLIKKLNYTKKPQNYEVFYFYY